MNTAFFLLLATCGNVFCENDSRLDQIYIAGGEDARIDEVPYQASVIFFDITVACGATIIHESWVLTAAHCIMFEEYLTVRTGVDKLNDLGNRYDLDYAVKHPEYNNANFNNDIALIKLKSPIIFNENQTSIPIATSVDVPEVGQYMLITGFGRLKDFARQPHTLQKGFVPVTDQEECEKAYFKDPITDTMFCAGNGIVDSCEGDSGGPAVINGKLYGVVSNGQYCPSSVFPGVYTRVHLYHDWIVKTTGIETYN